MTDHADLIARLKRHREVMGRDMLEWELVNRDGPEAASAIDALMNDVRVLKADLDRSEDNVARLIVERDEARTKVERLRVLLRDCAYTLAIDGHDGRNNALLARIDALLAKTEGAR